MGRPRAWAALAVAAALALALAAGQGGADGEWVECAPPDMCALVPPFALSGGVSVDGAVAPLNASLLACEPRRYENIVRYLEEGSALCKRFNAFYSALDTDLSILEDALGAHCRVCERARAALKAKGYASCGGALAGDGDPDPSACASAARSACPGACGGAKGQCPLCEAVPCRGGGSCSLQGASLPSPAQVLDCARLAASVRDACALGKSGDACELAERAASVRAYLEDRVLTLLPALARAMEEMADKARQGTANGTAPQPLSGDVAALMARLNGTFASEGMNASSFQSQLGGLLAAVAEPSVRRDIGREGHRASAEGVQLSGTGQWQGYCEGFSSGACFSNPSGSGGGSGQGAGQGVCAFGSAEGCNGRSPHCGWQAGRCLPSCGAWLVVQMGYHDDHLGCLSTPCPGRGARGVAYDCPYCCESWDVGGRAVFKDPALAQSVQERRELERLRGPGMGGAAADGGDGGGGGGGGGSGAGGNASAGDALAVVPLDNDRSLFFRFSGQVNQGLGGHLDPMTWGTPRITAMAAIDADGDGRDELAINFETDDNVWFYRWDGTIAETSGDHLDGMGWGDPRIRQMAAGDFDGDGRDELAINYDTDDHVWFYRWRGDVKARDGPRLEADVGDVLWGTTACDLDGDGRDELAVVAQGDRVDFYRWNGAITAKGADGRAWELEEHHPAYWGIFVQDYFPRVAAGDFDGDGRDEVAVRSGGRTVRFYRWAGAPERRNADFLDTDCGALLQHCHSRTPFSMLGGDFDADGAGEVAVFVNRLSDSTVVLFYRWDGRVGSVTADHIDPSGTKGVLLARVRAARSAAGNETTNETTDGNVTTDGNETKPPRVVTPAEYADACPPPECGSCGASPLPLSLELPNLDAYEGAALEAVEALAAVDPSRLFIAGGSCLTYTTPGSDCASVCRRCAGTSASHCHAQAGLCVCEDGPSWRLTGAPCEALPPAKARQVLACCARLFNATVPLVVAGPAPNASEECVPPADGPMAPFFDRCQTSSSGTGLCCLDGFEERPATAECIARGPTCDLACSERYGSNATLAARCAARCRAAPVREGGGVEGEPPAPGTPAEELERPVRSCLARCPTSNGTEVCERMCFAEAPDVAVEVGLLRGEDPVRAVYVGEMARGRILVRNLGLEAVEGNLSLSFALHANCACPPCERGASCPCTCSDLPLSVSSGLPLGRLGPDEGRAVEVPPFRVEARLSGLAFTPVVELRWRGALVGRGEGALVGAFPMDNVTATAARFVTPDGMRTVRAFPGTAVLGEVALATTVFPLAGELSMVTAGSPVNGSQAKVSIDGPGPFTFRTLAFTLPAELAGRVLELRLVLASPEGPALSTTFTSQGSAAGECSGPEPTSWCVAGLAGLKGVYPEAYLEVVRPALLLREAWFADSRGLRASRLYRPEEVRGRALVANPQPVAFSGLLSLTPVDAGGAMLGQAACAVNATLDPRASRSLETRPFTPAAGGRYRLLAAAAPAVAGPPWLDELSSPAVHPFSELEVGMAPLSGEAGRIATSVAAGGCRRTVRCEDCPPSCRLRLDSRTCELVRDECPCECVVG